ncbi:MAG: Gldg family protein [Nitrospira sp.]|nr:Gldg family protein [Nitrospira sp.]
MVIKHLLPVLGILGVGLGLGGLVLSQIEADRPGTIFLLEGIALLCLMIYFAGNWTRLKTLSGSRTTRLGLNGIMAILLMAGILTIINFLVVRHGGRWDLSETQHFSLAPQTLQVLGQLKNDVRVLVFAHERSPGFRTYRDLLEGYVHASPQIFVTYIDPEKEPGTARQYEISKIDTAVFESGGQTIHVPKPSESNLTSALIRVTKEQSKRLVFLEGHGERRITDQERGGLSLARKNLEAQGYQIARGSLRKDPALLDDTAVLIIPGPHESVEEEELNRITNFVAGGGRLLLLLDPQSSSGLEKWVTQWGLTLGPGIVVDPEDRVAQGSPTALLVRRFTDHHITKGFTAPILLPVVQPVSFEPPHGAALNVTSLLQSSEQSWAETTLGRSTPEFEEGSDPKGPFTLAVALGRKDTGSETTPALVLVGNSAFAGNSYVQFPGNTDFLSNAVAWLADENTLISVSPKESSFPPFIPNPTQEHMLFAVQVFSVPFLLLLSGLTVWRRRSRL